MTYCNCFSLIFLYLLTVCTSSILPQTGREHQQTTEDYEDSANQQTNNTDIEIADRIWNEYWSDWINIGVAHENDTYVDYALNNTEIEIRFLSMLHRVFKTGIQSCADRNKDCRAWAARDYCTHIKSRYRSWMTENCPQSCNVCASPPAFSDAERSSEPTCRNRRPSCDILFRFCTGPFSNHMTEWCPRTCNLCSASRSPNHQENEHAAPSNRSSSSSGNRVLPLNNCYPTNCGTVPILARRSGKRKRSLRYGFSRNPSVSLKIVGGSRAVKGEWPWHGLLVQQINEHARYCGITIICRHWVVTAAHCVVSPEQGFALTRQLMKTFTLYVGRHQGLFGFSEESTQSFSETNFDRFVIHPSFRLSPSFSHDIALIKLKLNSPIQFNRLIQPICLPSVKDLNHGDMLSTYGWGSTLGHGPSAQSLKKIHIPFINQEMCRRKVWGLETTGVLCAGGNKNTDACTGDSGGSLVMKRPTNDSFSGRYFFYGVTSYGTYYCNSRSPYKPGIFTDVAYYSAWIQKQTNGCCADPTPETPTRDFESSLTQTSQTDSNTTQSPNNSSSTQPYRSSNSRST